MIIMPANQTNELVHLWAGRWPGRIGHLYTPARKERVRPWLPYALDNGRYSDATNCREFDEEAFIKHVERYVFLAQKPLWLVVPDVPFFGAETLAWWDKWEPRLRKYNVPLALAVQNGISVADARASGADVIFVGGDTKWKWETTPQWAAAFARVHVGRVNSHEKLYDLHRIGVESCDGSGWFRGKAPQVAGLGQYLAVTHGGDVSSIVAEAMATRITTNYSEQMVLMGATA